MKKSIIIGSIIILITLATPLTLGHGLAVGDEFNVEVKKAHGSFSYTNGATTVSGNTSSFRVGDTSVPIGGQIRAQVDALPGSNEEFSLYDSSNNLLKDVTSSSLGFHLALFVYSFYPFITMGMVSGTANPIDVDIGVSLSDIFYIAPPSINWDNLFDDYNDTEQWAAYYDAFEGDEGNMSSNAYAQWYDDNETISFFVAVAGNYVISAENTDLSIIHNLRFDYNVTNNILQGYNMFTWIYGQYNGETTTFSMSVQVKEENYTRRMGSPFMVAALGILTAFGIYNIITRRRRK